jgi:hypothetical protein
MIQETENRKKGILRYSREAERTFFFYATVAMFIFYGLLKLLGG